ncbi:hypothetical protein [Pigmentiphaga litoralis]|uniref:hypothetical protein n=1 Tax=Pigmentiphaga litoralis TaxID=516702 RepID=UPI0016777F96|nr:hypothetical protein [Pigmentiphaga litoralis]
MAEAVVGVLVLGVLLHVVAATDRVQDLALRASMAGRYAAMLLTRNEVMADGDLARDVRERFFAGPWHRWQTRQGDAMLSDATTSVRVTVGERSVHAGTQVGQHDLQATTLRQEVLQRDRGMDVATVAVMPRLGRTKAPMPEPGWSPGLNLGLHPGLTPWASMSLRLNRHTAILTDAGHATSDRGVTERLQRAPQTWAASAAQSTRVGKEVTQQLSGIDRPWGRPLPQFDWLTPWETLVPADRLRKWEDLSWDR